MPGISNCILISDSKYEWFEKWEDMRTHKRGGEYDTYKEKFAQKLLDVLYDKVSVPKLRQRMGNIVFIIVKFI